MFPCSIASRIQVKRNIFNFSFKYCYQFKKNKYYNKIIQHNVYSFQGISEEAMEFLLDYMYNGSVDVPKSEMNSIISAAEELEIKGLVSAHHKLKLMSSK